MKKINTVLSFFALMLFVAGPVSAQQDEIAEMLRKVSMKCSQVRKMKCLFIKDVVKKGEAIPTTSMTFKYLKDPETIFVEFLDRYKGQKCLYIKGQNDDRIVVRPSGIMKFMTLRLDPLGKQAMAENVDPMTGMGFENVMKSVDEWYSLSRTDDQFAAELTENLYENDRPLYRINIYSKKDPNRFLWLMVDRETLLPYKLSYRVEDNGATYIYDNLITNCDFGGDDFKI